MNEPTKTVFCDIDGTIVHQSADFLDWYKGFRVIPNASLPNGFGGYQSTRVILEGVAEKLLDWHTKGYRIILTTGRPESDRRDLVDFFSDNGIYFHQLIMDCGSGIRYLINDYGPGDPNKAVAINLPRNQGIGDVKL